jgi:hypothetical protein
MSATRGPSHRAGVGIALLVIFLWSSFWILVRWGLDDEALPPIAFAALRYGVAALLLLAVVVARPEQRAALSGIDGESSGINTTMLIQIALLRGSSSTRPLVDLASAG